jgi:arylsulfatase A-like enzyme/tetratricopeptide (TPR) repeat protein
MSSRIRARIKGATVILLALVAASCTRAGVSTYPTASVVLISIDTLRADRTGPYGYRKGRTPTLDRLAREGIVVDDVYSHVPLTLPAHASMLTGLLPPRHEVRDNLGFRLGEGHLTLAERFKAAGLATGGAVSAYVLRSQTGIAQGFDTYDDALVVDTASQSLGSLQRDGGIAVDSLLGFVAAQGERRFFAFLHLYEPHSPWKPPERFQDLGSPYDGDVAHADELLGRFLEGLRARKLLDRVILAVTSDHGEGLLDHGEEEHGIFLYREAVHVPLLLRLPGGAGAGTRVAGPIAQVDLAPTLLELAGLDSTGTDGQSLRAELATGKTRPRTVYSETLYPRYHLGWSELYAASEGRFRLIRAPRPELYDLERDPLEKENLARERPQAVASMDAWLSRVVGSVTTPEAVDAETREKLAALGYVGGGAGTLATGDLPDPKDRIASYESFKRALVLRQAGRDAEAVEQFRKVVAENPLMTDAWESLGLSLIRLDREREGIAALNQVLEIDPLRADTHMALAKLYGLQGKTDRAARHAELGAGREPAKGFELLAQILMDAKRPREAADFARRSLAADPQRMMSHFILGILAKQQGRCEEALASFRAAAAAKSRQKGLMLRSLHFQTGDCLARLGREAEAEKEFLAELEALPASAEARVGLAMLYRSQGRDVEARAALGGLVQAEKAPTAETYWTVVRTFAVLGDAEAAREWARQARARFPADPRFR